MANITARHAIKLWLLQNNRTQRWLAKRVGISDSMLSGILRGYEPAPVIVRRLAKTTGIDLNAPANTEQVACKRVTA